MKTGNTEYSEEHTRRREEERTQTQEKNLCEDGNKWERLREQQYNNPNMGPDRLHENNQDCVGCHGLELDRSKNKLVVIVLNAKAI
jgi:hypothetical protein